LLFGFSFLIQNNVDAQTGVISNGVNIKIVSGTVLFVPGSMLISGTTGSVLK
jgi:hypothetical protein